MMEGVHDLPARRQLRTCTDAVMIGGGGVGRAAMPSGIRPQRRPPRSVCMLALVLMSAVLSFAVTVGAIVLLDISIFWGLPIYGVVGAVLTLIGAVIVSCTTDDDI